MPSSQLVHPRTRTLALVLLLALSLALALAAPSATLARTHSSSCSSSTRSHAKRGGVHACPPSSRKAKPKGKAKAKGHAQGAGGHHAKHVAHKPKKAKRKAPAPALVSALCEDGSEPVLSGGALACDDGSEPACEDDSTPKLSHGGKELLCPAPVEEASSSIEAECEAEGSCGSGGEGAGGEEAACEACERPTLDEIQIDERYQTRAREAHSAPPSVISNNRRGDLL